MPDELYELLKDAVEQALLASDSVQAILEDISGGGSDIQLEVWAKIAGTLAQVPAGPSRQFHLFEPGFPLDLALPDWMPTEEDVEFLRGMGVSLSDAIDELGFDGYS